MKDLLHRLRDSPEFVQIMEEMKKNRPTIPKYAPGNNIAEDQHQVETFKFASGRQEGFDLLFTLLTNQRP